MADPTRPEPQQIDPIQVKNFDLDPSLALLKKKIFYFNFSCLKLKIDMKNDRIC